jgi:hypothetical protein
MFRPRYDPPLLPFGQKTDPYGRLRSSGLPRGIKNNELRENKEIIQEEKYNIEKIWERILNGYSAGREPSTVRITRQLIRNQKLSLLDIFKEQDLDMCRLSTGKINSIQIENTIAKTPRSLSGIALKIA